MQGLEAFTESGVRQVGVYPSLCVLSSVDISTGWTSAPSGYYKRSFSASAPANSLVAVTGNNNSVIGAMAYSNGGGTTTATLVSNSAGSKNLQAHVIGPFVGSDHGYGIQSYDASGKLIFDSSSALVKVIGIASPSDTSISNALGAGRIAVPLISQIFTLSTVPNPQLGGTTTRAIVWGFQFNTKQTISMSPIVVIQQNAGMAVGNKNAAFMFPVFSIPD